MAANKLVLNSDKTHLLVMASSTQHRLHGNYRVQLDTGAEIILPQDNERLLGCQISSDFKWNAHVSDSKFSMQRQITSRLNALRKISFASSFATRKMIANGIIISRIIYAIQCWGGASDYLVKILQVLQNKAARFVTKLDIFTSQDKLLKQCGWLSVKQLIAYHSMVQVFKVKSSKKPVFLHEIASKSFGYPTRASTSGSLVDNKKTTNEISKDAFLFRSTKLWNILLPSIRKEINILKFKYQLREWVKIKIPQ